MLDLILLIVFGVILHRLAVQKGESPGKWIMRMVFSYLVLAFTLVGISMFYMGTDVFIDPDKIKQVVPFMTICLAGLIGIFLILRYKLTGMDDVEYYDEDPKDTELPKKDFSHFR